MRVELGSPRRVSTQGSPPSGINPAAGYAVPALLLPVPLASVRAVFSYPDRIFELRWDGFRSLAHIGNSRCRLVSRNGNDFKSFPTLSEAITSALGSRSAVIDGEIVCLDGRGKPQFGELLHHRGEPRFVAFDFLRIDGEDRTYFR